MISKNNKGEEVKAMIFPCVDDARFNQKKKEKKRQVRKGDSDGDSGDKKMRLRGDDEWRSCEEERRRSWARKEERIHSTGENEIEDVV